MALVNERENMAQVDKGEKMPFGGTDPRLLAVLTIIFWSHFKCEAVLWLYSCVFHAV